MGRKKQADRQRDRQTGKDIGGTEVYSYHLIYSYTDSKPGSHLRKGADQYSSSLLPSQPQPAGATEQLTFPVVGQAPAPGDGVVGDDEEEPPEDVLAGAAEAKGVVLLATALEAGQQSQQQPVTFSLEAGAHTLDHRGPATSAASVHSGLQREEKVGVRKWEQGVRGGGGGGGERERGRER